MSGFTITIIALNTLTVLLNVRSMWLTYRRPRDVVTIVRTCPTCSMQWKFRFTEKAEPVSNAENDKLMSEMHHHPCFNAKRPEATLQ